MTSTTVTASSLREMSAIFFPKMPYRSTSAVTCTTAMYTQPKPICHAWPGPPTKELTEP